MSGDYLIWGIVTLVSTITSFLLGWRKQKRADQRQVLTDQQQFNDDNAKFRKEVLSLLEEERKRVIQLEQQIVDLKEVNHQQALRSVQDAGRVSKLLLLIERYKHDVAELQDDLKSRKEITTKLTQPPKLLDAKD